CPQVPLTADRPSRRLRPSGRSPATSCSPGGTAIQEAAAATREEGTSIMSKSYHIRLDNGAMITFGSPQAIKDSLEVHWPAGHYDIHEGPGTDPHHGQVGRRWGTAIKRPDGAVTIAAESGGDR